MMMFVTVIFGWQTQICINRCCQMIIEHSVTLYHVGYGLRKHLKPSLGNGVVSLALLCCLLSAASGQQEFSVDQRMGVPYDWSHHHVIFSESDSPEIMREVQKEPRYWQQRLRTRPVQPPVSVPPPHRRSRFKRDWGESMGSNAYNETTPTYPAKYVFDALNPTPDCTNDYVVFTLPAPSSAFNVIAFNNLYVNTSSPSLCSGTAPTILFDYNALTNNGKLASAPVLSLDGTRIAFIENASQSRFHVLKWRAGDVGASFPAPYNTGTLADCATNGGVAPCEYTVAYSSHQASLSSPYVDYKGDTAYVSDDNGQVWAIHPVFKGGTPAVVSGYPVTPGNGGDVMTPPVYDGVSGNVFVADQHGNLFYIRTSAASAGSCASGSPPCVGSPTLNVANGQPVLESPMVDSTSHTVFVFSNGSPDNNFSSVVQTNTQLSISRQANVGSKGGQSVYSGSFDQAYFSNPGSGKLYVCGQDSGSTPALYAITFSGTAMNTGTAAFGPLDLATGGTNCSPLTENFNQSASVDYLFVGVANNCKLNGLPGNAGCVYSFPITSGFPPAASAVGVTEANGITGIIVDNVSNGSSGLLNTNIYFLTQGKQTCPEYNGTSNTNGNCAIKLTQSGLN